MNRLNNSSFDESALDGEVNDSSREVKTLSLIITAYLILLPVVGAYQAVQLGIKSHHDLVVNDRQYQQFSVCLNDLDQIEQVVTGSLIKQKLTIGLNCLEKLPISIRNNMTYQNLQSIEQELANQDEPYSVFLYQDKLSSLAKKLDLNLFNKTTIGLVTNTIIDSLCVMVLLMGFFVGSIGMYLVYKLD